MRKNVRTVVAETVKKEVKSYIRLALKYTLFVIAFVYLFVNIHVSQTISPLYDRFITEDIKAAADLTKKVHTLSDGDTIATMQGSIYGPQFATELNSDQTEIDQKINMYKTLLAYNPKARDVLYDLYLL